jgi:hypothetical protein
VSVHASVSFATLMRCSLRHIKRVAHGIPEDKVSYEDFLGLPFDYVLDGSGTFCSRKYRE